MFNLESNNPALNAAREFDGDISTAATISGVVDKTIMMTGLASVAGVLAYGLLPVSYPVLIGSCLAALIFGVGIAWYLAGNPMKSATWTPIYAVFEGVFLGVVTKFLDVVLANSGYAGGSLALPALIITVSCALSMLGLYRAKIIQPTRKFKAVMFTLTCAIMLAYLMMFVLQLAGIALFPHLAISSAFAGGSTAMIGLGLNVFILVIASLWLIIDFGEIEAIVESGKPSEMEWYGAFMLLITLTWIYYEAVKLAFRIAAATSSSD